MSIENEPTGRISISEQELREAFNQKIFDDKKREQKERNELSNTARDVNALKNLIGLLQQCEKARAEAQNTTDMQARRIYEEKTSAFNQAIKEYYLEQKTTAEQALTDYPNKDLTQKMVALDAILEEIKNTREKILKNWTSPDNSYTDRDLWAGKTWEQGVVAQAEHYARKNNPHAVAHVNKTIAEIEQAGIPLTDDEKKQFMDSIEDPSRIFREQLALASQEGMAPLQLQIVFAGYMLNIRRAENEIIDRSNKARAPEAQIPPRGFSKASAIGFANSDTSISDINQIIFNKQNFTMDEALKHYQESVGIMKNEANAERNATLITHCEVKATSPAPYDPDKESRFALQPQPFSSNNYSILEQACAAVNNQIDGEPLIIHGQKGLNIAFEYKNERFSFNTGSAKFSADNIHQETFNMMMELHSQIYKGSDTTIKCDGPVSKNLCAASIERAGIPNVQVTLEGGRPAAERQNITPVAKYEERTQQNMTASRRM